jgi:hypothetical protein
MMFVITSGAPHAQGLLERFAGLALGPDAADIPASLADISSNTRDEPEGRWCAPRQAMPFPGLQNRHHVDQMVPTSTINACRQAKATDFDIVLFISS